MNPLNVLNAYRYEAIAFLTGAAVMTLEIVGARLIAPAFGTSTYVWTAMIGIILGSLAMGYALGGRLADREDHARLLAPILVGAALLVLLLSLLHQPVLQMIAALKLDLRLSALLAALLLFSLPSLLIGAVSPHLAKLRVTSLASTGQSIGRLEAAGALGSIAGTFLCGYFLLGFFGSRSILVGAAVVLLATSLLVDHSSLRRLRLFCLALAAVTALLANSNPPSVLADVDSSYARYQVAEGVYNGTPVRMLKTDNGSIQSAVPLDGSDKLVLSYVEAFSRAAADYGNPGSVLLVGGGTYTFPSALIRIHPEMRVDVAEIDPTLDRLAEEYFYYRPSPRLTVHHSDGRAYLNETKVTYNMIFMDAFSSLSPPYQLTTRQAVGHIHRSLSSDGAVIVNLIGTHGESGDAYLDAVLSTYRSKFRHVALQQVNVALPLRDVRQNFLLYASDSREVFTRLTQPGAGRQVIPKGPGHVLTDDFAPVERLTY